MVAPGRMLPGSWGDAANVEGFLTHVLRREYGTFRLFAGNNAAETGTLEGLPRYASSLRAEDGGIAVALAAVGSFASLAAVLSRRSSRSSPCPKTAGPAWAALATLVSFLLYTGVFHRLANLPLRSGGELFIGVHARFWMQSNVALYVLAGVGAGRLLFAAIPRRGAGAACGSAAAVVAAVAWTRVAAMDESGNVVVRDAMARVLDGLPDAARVIVKGDLFTNSLRYLQQCEGRRTDVQLVDQAMLTYAWFLRTQRSNFPAFDFPGTRYHPWEPETGGFSMAALLDASYAHHPDPIFVLGGWNPQDPTTEGRYALVPVGHAAMAARASRPWEAWRGDVWAWYGAAREALGLDREHARHRSRGRGEGVEGVGGEGKTGGQASRVFARDRWESVVMNDALTAEHQLAFTLLNHGIAAGGADPDAFEEAVSIIEGLLGRYGDREGGAREAGDPAVYANWLRNLGVAIGQLMQYKAAWRTAEAHERMRAAFERYLRAADRAGIGVPGREEIEAVVSQHA